MPTGKEKKIQRPAQSDLLDAGEESSLTPEEINFKVQQAQQALVDLRRKQEEIERQKRELEELNQKQEEFHYGRRDILEKLNRGLVVLERREFEVKKEAEQIETIRDDFAQHLRLVQEIDPESWDQEQLPEELTRALARIEQAQTVFAQSQTRLEVLREGGAESGNETSSSYGGGRRSFASLVRDGFAFSLPLLILLFVLILVLAFRR